MIKFTDDKPVALCNRCFIIICYLACDGEDEETCVIIEKNGNDDGPYTSVKIGKKPPAYCSACENLFKYTLNE